MTTNEPDGKVKMRVSQIVVQVLFIDEYDAPKQSDPVTFTGDADGTAVEQTQRWIKEFLN